MRPTSNARLSIEAQFSPDAVRAAASLADFGIQFDHVRIIVVRPLADTLVDTTVPFVPGQADLTTDLTVSAHTDGEVFNVTLQYRDASTVYFEGTERVASHPPSTTGAGATTIHVVYVGVGAATTRITIGAHPSTLLATASTTLTAQAFDASGSPVPAVPISWSTSDATLATITPAGTAAVLQPTGRRGTVTVTARTPNDVSDQVSIAIALPPATIALVSGGGQTGSVGAVLASPAVVEVRASDGLAVAGIPVTFTPPLNGAVGTASVTSDANGRASTSLTLGRAAGAQNFSASASGFSVAIPATALAGSAAAVVAVSGGGQSDTLRKKLAAPLMARVNDQFGNAVAGVTVTWARTGGGSLGAASSVTGPDGQASVTYTLGGVVGTETITASAAGVTGSATFIVSAVAAAPSAIAVVSGDGQAAAANASLGNPLVVKVSDGGGFAVPGVAVTWTATNGVVGAASTTTDASGQASNTVRVGTVTGGVSITATIAAAGGARSVAFSATATPGAAARLQFRAQPASATAGVALAPAVQVALLDAFGNLTAATNAVSMSLGGGASGAVLLGTLMRNAVGGVATFGDLAIDRQGTGYTLTASALSVGAPVVSAPFDVGAAGILFDVGGSTTATVTAGQDLTIPLNVDLTNRGTSDLASITVTITWDPARFTFKSQTAGTWVDNTGGASTIIVNTVNTATGTMQIAGFTAAETFASFTLGTVVLTANGTASQVSTSVTAVVTAAGNAAGSAVTVTPRALTVTVNP